MNKNVANYASKTIGQKVLVAVLLSILFLVAAVYITKFTFSEVTESISRLSLTNKKNKALSAIYTEYGDFERNYQAPLLADADGDSEAYYAKNDSLNNLIDSTMQAVPFSEEELFLLDSVKAMLEQQNEQLLLYRAYKRAEQPMLRKNLDSLSNLITADEILRDADVVTTYKSTRRIPAPPQQVEKPVKEEKKNIFQRVFGGSDDEEVQYEPEPLDTIEETFIKRDTVPLAKADTSKAKADIIIKDIKRGLAFTQRKVSQAEIEIVQYNARIQNFILTLLRNTEEVELARIQKESEAANKRMQDALAQMYLVLGIFGILATFLVLRILSDLLKAKYYRLQLVEEKERAENLSKVKERFLANMSHEIRTPLQNILGYSEKIFAKDKSRDSEIIQQSSEHLLQIVNQVLDFSRISTGKLSLHPESVDFEKLLSEVVNSMNIQASKKDIRLLFESNIVHSQIYIDPFRLRQILYNLLGNAIKFTDNGFIKLYAKTESKDSGILIFFTVEDSGIGMTESELKSVFQEFEQAGTPSHASNGTGLGLSITKALVEAYNGDLIVESKKNEGTKFSVSLITLPVPETPELVSETELNPLKQRILVVDDDETILNLTTQILVDHGFDVVAETSPLAAIEISKNQEFDIALVDFRMPEMTGAELCQKLKSIQPALPVVAVTANVFSIEEKEKTVDGFDFYLPKPFKAKDLLGLVGYSKIDELVESSTADTMKAKIDQLTFGDAELGAELLAQFKMDCHKDNSDLEKALLAEDEKPIRELVHRLSGRLAFFEFTTLASGFRQIESEIETGQYTKESKERLGNLRQELEEILETI